MLLRNQTERTPERAMPKSVATLTPDRSQLSDPARVAWLTAARTRRGCQIGGALAAAAYPAICRVVYAME